MKIQASAFFASTLIAAASGQRVSPDGECINDGDCSDGDFRLCNQARKGRGQGNRRFQSWERQGIVFGVNQFCRCLGNCPETQNESPDPVEPQAPSSSPAPSTNIPTFFPTVLDERVDFDFDFFPDADSDVSSTSPTFQSSTVATVVDVSSSSPTFQSSALPTVPDEQVDSPGFPDVPTSGGYRSSHDVGNNSGYGYYDSSPSSRSHSGKSGKSSSSKSGKSGGRKSSKSSRGWSSSNSHNSDSGYSSHFNQSRDDGYGHGSSSRSGSSKSSKSGSGKSGKSGGRRTQQTHTNLRDSENMQI